MNTKKLLLCGLTSLCLTGNITAQQPNNEETSYRPNFHFTPKNNWMNDPNGLFYADGVYHLYFQYWPYGNIWGPMHWGHATSKDLVKWEEQPIALYPDRFGYIFSGSAAYDAQNTSGFGEGGKAPAIAIFTYHDPVKEKAGQIDVESQGLAYSLDNGQTWIKYDQGNPVIKNPGIRDFRDPKVNRDWVNNRWILVLAAQDRAQFYASDNLKDWKHLSDFGVGIGAHGGVWECPDFFPLKVKGSEEVKWVLVQSLNPGGANGGSGTQYFIGDFDGTNFTVDKGFNQKLEKDKALWLDFGRDNYAGVTWGGAPGEQYKRYFIGWMSNWDYANVVPTQAWRGANTVVRELELVKDANGYRLNTAPVKNLQNYIAKTDVQKKISVKQSAVLVPEGKTDLTQADISLKLNNLKKETYTFVLSNADGDELRFGIDNAGGAFFIDRSKSSNATSFHKFTAGVSKAKLPAAQKHIKLRFLLDKTSLEIFYNEGEMALTEIFYTKSPFTSLRIEGGQKFDIENLTINQLNFN